jgi:N-terminal domain of toast_rack, DUF2154/Domain of unknown function (DUF5668)
MDQPEYHRRRSLGGPITLIAIGCIFLVFTLYPTFNPFPILWRYWPLILIFLGLGKIWDSYYARRHPDQSVGPWISGTGVAWTLLLVLFILAAWRGGWRWQRGGGWDDRSWGGEGWWHSHSSGREAHDTQAVELQGAKSVDMNLDIPAGQVTLSGGSSRLLDADFRYDENQGKPTVEYSVAGERGNLSVRQDGNEVHPHFGNEDNEWNMRVANDVPVDLQLEMGAGQSDLRLSGVNLKSLDVHMGAGQLDLDLTGPRKTSVDGTIEGGVGQATVRLPKDVGVHVEASGGIGSVDTSGLKRDGDTYVNDAYGKTATSIDLTIHGGVGEIRLIEE